VSVPHQAALSTLPDEELVVRIRSGDAHAFEMLFKAYFTDLCSFTQSYVDRATGEELIQDLFLRIWRRREALDPACSIRGYLFQAARNQALNAIRKRRSAARTAERYAEDEERPGADQLARTPAQELTASEIETALRREIHALPETNRVVMILRWQYGMSHAKIAFILGITVKGVEAELTRGLSRLASRLAWLRV
jgi:RNA polymerase sigma-70 factor (ECF subfamily)